MGTDSYGFSMTLYAYYFDSTAGYQDYTNVTYNSVISLANLTSIDLLAERIKTAIFGLLYYHQALNPDSPDVALAALIKDIQFDSTSQKLCVIFAPSTTASQNYYNGSTLTNSYLSLKAVFSNLSDATNAVYTLKQNKLICQAFGGDVGPVHPTYGNTWTSTFQYDRIPDVPIFLGDTSPIAFRTLMNRMQTTNTKLQTQFTSVQSFVAYAPNMSSLIYDPYMYIRGSPESQTWTTDGGSSDILAILPRNRAVNSTVSIQTSFLTGSTFPIKTSLQSLRVMNLRITDKDGDAIPFNTDYILQLGVLFNID